MSEINPFTNPFSAPEPAPFIGAAVPGRKMVENEDGSLSSEMSVTVEVKELNSGKPTNIPTMFEGVVVPVDEAIQRIIEADGRDPETGRLLPGFKDTTEAVAEARKRSQTLGEGVANPFTPPEARPGLFRRNVLEPLVTVSEAAFEGYKEGFDLFTDKSILRPLEVHGQWLPSMQHATQAMVRGFELSGRNLTGGLFAAGHGFHQFIQSVMGLDKGDARRVTRDMFALMESTIPLLGLPATALPRAARTARRTVMRSATFEAKKAAILAEQEDALVLAIANRAARAKRRADQAAGKRIPPGGVEQQAAVVKASTSVSVRGVQDAQEVALGLPYLDDPAKISRAEFFMGQPAWVQRGTMLTVEAQKRAMEVAVDILQARGIAPGSASLRTIQETIHGLLRSDEQFTVLLKMEAEAAGFKDFGQFLDAFLFTGSEGGRALNIRSQFMGTLRRRALVGAKDDPSRVAAATGVREAFEDLGRLAMSSRPLTAMEGAEFWLQRATTIFRKSIISLPVTATRNLIEAGGIRMVITGANRLVDSTLQRIFFPGKAGTLNPSESFDILARVWTQPRMTAETVDRLIDAFPAIRTRLFKQLEADIGIDPRLGIGGNRPPAGMELEAPGLTKRTVDAYERGLDRYLLAYNRGQEFMIRRGVLATRLDEELRRIGSSVTEMVDEGIIPLGFNKALSRSIDDALEMTYALPPTKQRGINQTFRGIANAVEGSKVGPFALPFVRFSFNQVKFILEQMPTAFLRLMGPGARAKIATGDFSQLAKEIVGAALLGTAFAVRSGAFPGLTPGEKYDEVITEDGTILPFAPLATMSPFLYVADVMQRIDEGRFQTSTDTLTDLLRGTLGTIPELSKTSDSVDSFIKTITEVRTLGDLRKFTDVGGAVGGGFARPFALVKDFRAEWMDTARLQRETRGQGFEASFLNVIAPEMLPERKSPTRGATPMTPEFDIPQVTIPGEEQPGMMSPVDLLGDPRTQGLTGTGTLRLGLEALLAGQTAHRVETPKTVGAGLVSHLTGIRAREPRNVIERALAHEGFTGRHLSPKTSDPRLNALISRFQGPVMEAMGELVLTTQAYKIMPPKMRQLWLSNIINLSREIALPFAKRAAPAAFMKEKIKRMPSARRDFIIEHLDILARSQGKPVAIKGIIEQAEEIVDRELKALGL